MKTDINSLSHSSWRCKYHIVFAPKYRRQVIYGKIRADIGKILRELSERKGVKIIEAECCPDHIHMLVEIPPHLSVSSYMGYLKSTAVKGIGALLGSTTVVVVFLIVIVIFCGFAAVICSDSATGNQGVSEEVPAYTPL